MHGQHSVYGVSFDFFNTKSHDIYIQSLLETIGYCSRSELVNDS